MQIGEKNGVGYSIKLFSLLLMKNRIHLLMGYSIGLFSCLFLSGCVFVDTHLNIDYDAIKAEKSALASAPSLKIEVEEFEDNRSEKVISHKNIMETGAILTQKPMPEVMRSALLVLLKKNGHVTNPPEPQLVIGGEVKKMMMGFLPGIMTTEAVGSIVVRLNVKASNGKVIFTREYQGEYHQRTAYATMKIWEQVFNKTLENLMHTIAVDKALLEVFLAQTRPSTKTT